MRVLTVADLAAVVYSSGKVFDGLSTGRLDTENFLRSGNLEGINSRSDLALLEDLRDVAELIIELGQRGRPVDAESVCAINGAISRSGALHPGQLRTDAQQIGVKTRYGRHTPAATTMTDLQQIIDRSVGEDPFESAIDLFVSLAKAQPFEDGNKRTALFAANNVLISSDAGVLLTIPTDENDPSLSDRFNDLLARAYVHDDRDGVKDLLRTRGRATLTA